MQKYPLPKRGQYVWLEEKARQRTITSREFNLLTYWRSLPRRLVGREDAEAKVSEKRILPMYPERLVSKLQKVEVLELLERGYEPMPRQPGAYQKPIYTSVPAPFYPERLYSKLQKVEEQELIERGYEPIYTAPGVKLPSAYQKFMYQTVAVAEKPKTLIEGRDVLRGGDIGNLRMVTAKPQPSVSEYNRLYSKLQRLEIQELLMAGYEPVDKKLGTYKLTPREEVVKTPSIGIIEASKLNMAVVAEKELYPVLSRIGPRGPEYVYVPSPTPKKYLSQVGEAIAKEVTVKPQEPPKNVVEWISRGWEGAVKGFQKSLKPTEQLFLPATASLLGIKKAMPTQKAIIGLESAQQWLREAPLKPTFTITFTGIKTEFKYEKPTEPLARSLEYAYIPVGMFRAVEAPLSAVPIVVSSVAMGKVTPTNMVKGAEEWFRTVTKQPVTLITTFPTKQVFEHKGLLLGELAGQYLMGKYVYGPAVGKAWTKLKTSFVKRLYPEKTLYEKAVLSAQTMPDEETFKWLVKSEKGWTYQSAKLTEALTKETGKKTAWKPTLWEKPKGFKPTFPEWLPPEPMKTTALRELPKGLVLSSSRGMALIAKQTTKEITKVSLKQAALLGLVLPIVTIAVLPKNVPSLAKYKGPTFPSIYKQPKEVMTLSMPKLASYPQEKKKIKLVTVPKTLLLPSEKALLEPLLKKTTTTKELQLPKETKLMKLPQLPKEIQLPRETQVLKQPQLPKQMEQQAQPLRQMQKQMQKQIQTQTPRYKLTFEIPRIKKKLEGLRGEWFKREHKIATPEQVARSFGFRMGKKKKRRKGFYGI